MDVTDFGIVMDVSSEHEEKAPSYIVVTVSGIIVLLQPAISALVFFSIIALQLFLESYVLLFESTANFVSFEQLEKLEKPLPISLTELGMKTDLIPVQPLKAPKPMETTEFGIVTDVNPEQPAKALLPMETTEFGIVTDVNPEHSAKAASPIAVIKLGMIVLLQPAISSFAEVLIIALQLCLES